MLLALLQNFESRVSELEEEMERSRAKVVLAGSVPTLQAALEEQQRVQVAGRYELAM